MKVYLLIIYGMISLFKYHSTSSSQVLIDCHPDKHATEQRCKMRGCVWSPVSHLGPPWCHFNNTDPTDMAGYDVQHVTVVKNQFLFESIFGSLKRRPTPTLFGNDYQHLIFRIQQLSDKIVRVFISDINERQSRVPHDHVNRFLEISKRQIIPTADPEYEIVFDKRPFGFAVTRKSTGTTIVDTRNLPGLTFSEQFLQMSIKVPNDGDVFGLGENTHEKLKHDFNWKKWGLFTKDTRPGYSTVNLYGVHPFYLCVEDKTGNSHGVFLLNSHAMEVVFQPDPKIITYRPIGGVLEFYIFLGPTPNEVVQQYTSVVGRSLMPPYWAMGFQLCRWGYRNLTYLRRVFDRNRAAQIPQDVQFFDIDYMDNHMDFSVDRVNFANLTYFIGELHEKYKMKLVVIVDPAIANKPKNPYFPLEIGLKMDIFVKDSRTGRPLEGVVWPGTTYWVDFTHPSSIPFWTYCHLKFRELVEYDGIWIDMNEPSNFNAGSSTGCDVNKLNNPPFNPLIYDNITDMTLCLDAQQYLGQQYSLHNLYGYTEARATYRALQTIDPSKRPFVLSRSTYTGSGHYTNHWMGDNESRWPQLKLSIINLLEYQMFGFSLMGADICGFGLNATEELCLRWMQLGSFYPYMRNHNDIGSTVDQDPAAWPENTTEAMRKVLLIRYKFLPYLYTLLHVAHVNGTPMARPLFFDFPNDTVARLVDDQFLWGSGLMIVPILEPFTTKRYGYFPIGRWYNLTNGGEVPQPYVSRNLTIFIAKDSIGLFVRGGAILPVQKPSINTFFSRQNSFGIIAGLDENGRACGGLYWDDGESELSAELGLFSFVQFYAYYDTDPQIGGITFQRLHAGFNIEPLLDDVQIFGLLSPPNDVKLDGKPLQSTQIIYDASTRSLKLQKVRMALNQNHKITW